MRLFRSAIRSRLRDDHDGRIMLLKEKMPLLPGWSEPAKGKVHYQHTNGKTQLKRPGTKPTIFLLTQDTPIKNGMCIQTDGFVFVAPTPYYGSLWQYEAEQRDETRKKTTFSPGGKPLCTRGGHQLVHREHARGILENNESWTFHPKHA